MPPKRDLKRKISRAGTSNMLSNGAARGLPAFVRATGSRTAQATCR